MRAFCRLAFAFYAAHLIKCDLAAAALLFVVDVASLSISAHNLVWPAQQAFDVTPGHSRWSLLIDNCPAPLFSAQAIVAAVVALSYDRQLFFLAGCGGLSAG